MEMKGCWSVSRQEMAEGSDKSGGDWQGAMEEDGSNYEGLNVGKINPKKTRKGRLFVVWNVV